VPAGQLHPGGWAKPELPRAVLGCIDFGERPSDQPTKIVAIVRHDTLRPPNACGNPAAAKNR